MTAKKSKCRHAWRACRECLDTRKRVCWKCGRYWVHDTPEPDGRPHDRRMQTAR